MPIVTVVHVQVADEGFIIAGMGIANRGEAVAVSIAQVNGDLWKEKKGRKFPRKTRQKKKI